MELDILNDTSISFSWTYAFFNEKIGWIEGDIGYTGPRKLCCCGTCHECKPEDYQAVTEIVDKPEVLQFQVNVTTEDGFAKVCQFLAQFQGFCPKYTRIHTPDDQEKVERVSALIIDFKNNQEIKRIHKEINALIGLLEGIEDEYTRKASEYIPGAEFTCRKRLYDYDRDEYEETYDDDDIQGAAPFHKLSIREKNYNVCFRIDCMKGSKFYDFLEKYDLITRNWPDSIPKTRTEYIKK